MAKFQMIFEGVFGGPCPSPMCGASGELRRHHGEYGGYRTIVHTDAQGYEHVCLVPDDGGMLRTTGGRWFYVPAEQVEAMEKAGRLTAAGVAIDWPGEPDPSGS